MAVRFYVGVDEYRLTRLPPNGNIVGSTVRQVSTNASLSQVFGLDGRETVEVRRAGYNDWQAADGNYVIRDNDEVRFTRVTGEKGV